MTRKEREKLIARFNDASKNGRKEETGELYRKLWQAINKGKMMVLFKLVETDDGRKYLKAIDHNKS